MTDPTQQATWYAAYLNAAIKCGARTPSADQRRAMEHWAASMAKIAEQFCPDVGDVPALVEVG